VSILLLRFSSSLYSPEFRLSSVLISPLFVSRSCVPRRSPHSTVSIRCQRRPQTGRCHVVEHELEPPAEAALRVRFTAPDNGRTVSVVLYRDGFIAHGLHVGHRTVVCNTTGWAVGEAAAYGADATEWQCSMVSGPCHLCCRRRGAERRPVRECRLEWRALQEMVDDERAARPFASSSVLLHDPPLSFKSTTR